MNKLNKMLVMVVLGVVMSVNVNASWVPFTGSDDARVQNMVDNALSDLRAADQQKMYIETNKLLKAVTDQAKAEQAARDQRVLVKQLMVEMQIEQANKAAAELQTKQLATLIVNDQKTQAALARTEQTNYLTTLVNSLITKRTTTN